MMRAWQGLADSRGPRGIAARGKNVYKAATMSPTNGPSLNAVARRMGVNRAPRAIGRSVDLSAVAKRELAARRGIRPYQPTSMSGPNPGMRPSRV